MAGGDSPQLAYAQFGRIAPDLRAGRFAARQMRHAIFFAVARDAEIEVRIGQFRRSADRAFDAVARLRCVTAIAKRLRRARDFTAMPRFVNDLRARRRSDN